MKRFKLQPRPVNKSIKRYCGSINWIREPESKFLVVGVGLRRPETSAGGVR